MRKGSKTKLATLALAGLGVVMSSNAAMAEGMKASSHGGVKIWNDQNSSYWFSLGSLIQVDQVFAHAGDYQANADFSNSAQVRRARLIAQGGIGCHWEYYFNVDFKNVNAPEWVNLYVQYDGFENSKIQAGVITQPLSLSNWTSTAAITTMERPMIAAQNGAFIPPYGLGLYADHQWELITLAAAVWEPLPSNLANNYPAANAGSDLLGVSGRLTFSPVHTPDYVWHFGVSGLYQNLHKKSNAPDYGMTIPLEMQGRSWPGFAANQLKAQGAGANGNGKSWSVAGVETAGLWGPLSIQAEYMGATVRSSNSYADSSYNGWYALVAYNLTGESKDYNFATGTFGKVTPAAASGAWEAFGQYSMMSLRDHAVGPVAHVSTVGVNWYATPAVKLIAEYSLADYGRLDAETLNGNVLPQQRKNVNMYGLRFQTDFSA